MKGALAWLLPVSLVANAPVVQEGDLVFQTSRSSQSRAIQLATGSTYSHMGIVLMHRGKLHVFEAVATVRYTPLSAWSQRGEGGRWVAKRVKAGLTEEQRTRLRRLARHYEGKPYDLTFAWSDRRIYCSELVWKLYQRATGWEIGVRQRLKDFRLDHPAVKAKLQERYGHAIPQDEPVISPVAMFDSPLLVLVPER